MAGFGILDDDLPPAPSPFGAEVDSLYDAATAPPAPVAPAPAAPRQEPVKFGDAFATARRAGQKTFEWQGKQYTTERADEQVKAPAPAARAEAPKGLGYGVMEDVLRPPMQPSLVRPSVDLSTPDSRAAAAGRKAATQQMQRPDFDFSKSQPPVQRAESRAWVDARAKEIARQAPQMTNEQARAIAVREATEGRTSSWASELPEVVKPEDQKMGASLYRGSQNLQSVGNFLGAVAADKANDATPKWLQDFLGVDFDQATAAFIDSAKLNQEEAARFPGLVKTFDDIGKRQGRDVGDVTLSSFLDNAAAKLGDTAIYAAEKTGENLFLMGPGLVGGTLGRSAAAQWSRDAIERAVERKAAQIIAAQGGALTASVNKAEAVRLARLLVADAAEKHISRRAMIGAAAGAVPGNVGVNIGDTASTYHGRAGELHSDMAIGVGTVAGALDVVGQLPIFKALDRLGGSYASEGAAAQLVRDLGADGAKAAAVEMPTEWLQTVLQDATSYVVADEPVDWRAVQANAREAALAAGLSAGAIAAVPSLVEGIRVGYENGATAVQRRIDQRRGAPDAQLQAQIDAAVQEETPQSAGTLPTIQVEGEQIARPTVPPARGANIQMPQGDALGGDAARRSDALGAALAGRADIPPTGGRQVTLPPQDAIDRTDPETALGATLRDALLRDSETPSGAASGMALREPQAAAPAAVPATPASDMSGSPATGAVAPAVQGDSPAALLRPAGSVVAPGEEAPFAGAPLTGAVAPAGQPTEGGEPLLLQPATAAVDGGEMAPGLSQAATPVESVEPTAEPTALAEAPVPEDVAPTPVDSVVDDVPAASETEATEDLDVEETTTEPMRSGDTADGVTVNVFSGDGAVGQNASREEDFTLPESKKLTDLTALEKLLRGTADLGEAAPDSLPTPKPIATVKAPEALHQQTVTTMSDALDGIFKIAQLSRDGKSLSGRSLVGKELDLARRDMLRRAQGVLGRYENALGTYRAAFGDAAATTLERAVRGATIKRFGDTNAVSQQQLQGAASVSEGPAASQPRQQINAADLRAFNASVQRNSADGAGLAGAQIRDARTLGRGVDGEISQRDAEFLVDVGRRLGRRVVFFSAGPGAWDGFKAAGNDDAVFINTRAKTGFMQVLGHEFTHGLKRRNLPVYRALRDAIIQNTDAAKVDAYRDEEYGPSPDIVEEMMADVMGNRFADPDFWTDVFNRVRESEGAKAPGALERLTTWLNKFLQDMRNLVSRSGPGFRVEDYLRNIDKVKAAYAKAMAEYLSGTPARPTASAEGVDQATPGRPKTRKEIAAENPDMRGVLRHLTDAELVRATRATRATLEKIRGVMATLPSAEDFAAAAWAGRAKRGWYEHSYAAIKHVFGADAWRFAALLAALSPQVSVETNLLNALNVWKNWVAAGRPTDPAKIKAVMGRSVQGDKGEDSVLFSWVNNTTHALTASSFVDVILSGPKVDSFMRNLLGYYDEVTNDAWMANFALKPQTMFSGSKNASGPGKGPGYKAYSARVRESAALLTRKTGAAWTPAEVQETVWSWAMTMLETMDSAGETRGAAELIDQGVLTDDAINATPDFRSLFHSPTYARILEDAGYRAELDTLKVPTGKAEASHGRAPFAPEKLNKLLKVAGLRLEFLQRQRRTSIQLSWEARPGESTGVLPGIHSAPLEMQQQYLADVFAAIEGAGFKDVIGFSLRDTFFAPSAWEGKVLAGAQTRVRPGIDPDGKGSVMVDADSRRMYDNAAAVLGLVLNQEGVPWHYPIYTNNPDEANGVEVNIGRPLTHAEAQELYDKVSRVAGHDRWAPAMTGTGARILNFEDVPNRDFHRQIKRALVKLNDWADGYQARPFKSDGSFLGNDWKEQPNGEGYLGAVTGKGRPDILRWATGPLQAAVDAVNRRYSEEYGWGAPVRAERELDAASPERPLGRGVQGSGESQSRNATRPEYGRATPGSVSAVGVHYSTEARNALNGAFYGRGLPGAEREAVMAAKDKRLRFRVYFYVSDGAGVFPEGGVGGQAHTVKLNNLYDFDADPLNLKVGRTAIAYESAVLDAGFDGYVADFGNRQRAAVLIGPKHAAVPVRHEPFGYRGEDLPRGERAKASDFWATKAAVENNRSLPDGMMPGASWKRIMGRVMPDVDVSHLDDEQTYYKDQIVKRPDVDMASPQRVGTINVDGVERSRANSKGQPIHPTEEGIRNFWRWFGDSKVVDEQGRPLVVYHGTGADFSTFIPSKKGWYGAGIYLTPSADFASEFDTEGDAPNVMPLYAAIQQPYMYEEAPFFARRNPNDPSQADMLRDILPRDKANRLIRKLRDADDARLGGELQPALRSLGYDGIVVEAPDGQEVIAFDPNQIKSATGNAGSFDSDQDSILASPQRESAVLTRIYKTAGAAKPDFDAKVREIASVVGVKAVVPDTLKGRERAWKKIKSDYNGDASKIKDVLRASLVAKSTAAAQQVVDALQRVFEVHQLKSTLDPQSPAQDGYRDAKVFVKVDGIVAEIQVHVAQMEQAKALAHGLYEQRQAIERAAAEDVRPLTEQEKARIETLNAKMRQIYYPAWARARSSRATISRKVDSDTIMPFRSTDSPGNRRLSGSKAKYPNAGDSIRATGTSSTSKNLVPSGNLSGSMADSSEVDDGDYATPARRIIGDSGRQYTPEQQALFDNVGRAETPDGFVKTVKNWLHQRWTQGIFDQFAPIKDLGEYAYTLARLSRGASGAMEALLHHGKLSIRDGAFDADMSGGLLETVFYPLGKETTDFLYWIAGNRAERLAAEGRENLFSPQDIQAAKDLATGTTDFDYTLQNGAVTRNRADIYQDSLEKFNGFQGNVLDVAEMSGLIDPLSRHMWEHEFYVPFYRVAEDADGTVRGGVSKGSLLRQKAFEKLKGGKEQLNDLLGNTLMNMAHLIDASAKNRAAKETLETAALLGAARPAQPGDKGVVWFMDGGQKQEYVVEDDGLVVAIESLDFVGMRGPIWTALTKPKHWLTIGVTASPYFKIRNLIRDSVQAVAVSGLSGNIAKNLYQGAKYGSHRRQDYVSALAGGGLIRFGTMLEGNEAARTRQLIKKGASDAHILDSEGKLQAFYDSVIEPAISAYNELGNRGEEINRMALYRQLTEQGVDHATASLMARDLMDFSLQGSFATIRVLSQVVPFFNARMQGLYKLGRAAAEQPGKMSAVVASTALVSLALLAAYRDDDDWKKREDWDRDNYWWFKVGGIAYRVPKPFEVGAVATLAERMAEKWFDDEMTWKRFSDVTLSLFGNQLAMNPVPQAFKPILDIYSNKDSFTKRPIESMSLERLDPEMRYNASTSMVARGASEAIGGALSPVQIDHLIRGYFAWLGSVVVGGTDSLIRAVSDEPVRPAKDVPKFLSGGMVAELDSASSRYVTQMYDQLAEVEKAYNTWRHLVKAGRYEDARTYREENAKDIARYKEIKPVKGAVSAYAKQIREVERSEKYTPAEKKLRIIELRRKQNEAAKRLSQ